MKSAKQQKEKIPKLPVKRKAGGPPNSTTCSRGRHTKANGSGERPIAAKEGPLVKHDVPQVQGCYSSEKVASPVEDCKPPSIGQGHQMIPSHCAKIKLQLFPLDKRIRMGLEQDGYNPHLELTLSSRKKVSSILKHLNSKWGSSSVAMGDPMLFPFDIIPEKLAAYRSWTLDDNTSNAGDVHAAVGSPAIFRLRYGWFSAQGTTVRSAASSLACRESGVSGESRKMVLDASEAPAEVIREEPINFVEQPTGAATEQMTAVDSLNNEAKELENKVSHTSALWSDSLSNISFGALLSGDSLFGKFSIPDSKSNGGRSAFDPTNYPADSLDAFVANQLKNAPEPNCNGPSDLVSDSFDASIAKYLKSDQNPRPLSVPSSILDAEETCHSFAFKKSTSSNKNFPGDGRSFFAGISEDGRSLLATEVNNKQDETLEKDEEPEAEAGGFSRLLFNEESSLGFSNIKWTDSLGPFDMGISTQQHMIKGDSISLSEFVRDSVKAYLAIGARLQRRAPMATM